MKKTLRVGLVVFSLLLIIILKEHLQRNEDMSKKVPSILNSRARFHDTLLTVTFLDGKYSTIPLMKRLFGSVFSTIVFCGSRPDKGYPIVVRQEEAERLSYACLVESLARYPNVTGYLSIHSDMWINLESLVTLSTSKPWEMLSDEPLTGQDRWTQTENLAKCKAALLYLNAMYRLSKVRTSTRDIFYIMRANSHGRVRCYRGRSEAIFIPVRLRMQVWALSELFLRNGVRSDIAMPTILRLLHRERNIIRLRTSKNWTRTMISSLGHGFSTEQGLSVFGTDIIYPINYREVQAYLYAVDRSDKVTIPT